MENYTNIQQEDQISKLSSAEFYTELKLLLKKAPQDMLYVINVCDDPKDLNTPDQDARSVVAVKGSMAKISFAFLAAFNEDTTFKSVVSTAVDFANFSLRSRNPFHHSSMVMPSMLAEMLRK